MDDTALATYLEDHLAGATGALELLKNLEEEHDGQPLGRAALELRGQIDSDRNTLEALSRQIGRGEHSLKEAASRLGERLSRWKLERGSSGPLGTLESLEFLALGIWGKRALWRALQTVAAQDTRLSGPEIDLGRLIESAERQHERVEELRLQAVAEAFVGAGAATAGREP